MNEDNKNRLYSIFRLAKKKKKKKKKPKKSAKKKKLIKLKPTFFGWIGWSLIGILLLPVLAVSVVATLRLFTQLPILSGSMIMLILGMLGYIGFHLFIYQPTTIYVLAHELTHAIFAAISGIKVRRIKVSSDHGFVEIEESNFLIDLAPYFFPLYSFLWSVLFLIFDRIYDLYEYYLFFFFMLGISIAFHWLANWETIKLDQPDLKMTGKIFGLIFILIANLLFLNIILTFVFINQINFSTLLENYIWAYHSFYK